jgi:hypothetical protein
MQFAHSARCNFDQRGSDRLGGGKDRRISDPDGSTLRLDRILRQHPVAECWLYRLSARKLVGAERAGHSGLENIELAGVGRVAKP